VKNEKKAKEEKDRKEKEAAEKEKIQRDGAAKTEAKSKVDAQKKA